MSNKDNVIQMLKAIGVPYAYDHFSEKEAVKPPFIVYRYPSSNNFVADARVYFKIDALHIELYTDKKNPDLEERVEENLNRYGFIYFKHEVWIDTEKMYQVLYETEV